MHETNEIDYLYSDEDMRAFWDYLHENNTFLFLGPKNTDGDTVGANTALAIYLEQQLGKKVILYCPNTFGVKYSFLPWIDRYVSVFDPQEPDAIFTSDTADETLFTKSPMEQEVLARGLPWVNLDHHISNKFYGTLNMIDTASASCTMIVYRLLKTFNARITPDMATNLLMGLYYDTGGLVHSNTSVDAYKTSSELVRLGANVDLVSTHLFRKSSVGRLKLLGLALDRAQMNEDGVLISALTADDLAECEATREDLEGVIDYLNAVPGKKFCLLLSEDGKGNVKGSMRTQETDVDVNKIAQTFGGGGHRMAAGFTIKGSRLEPETRWKVVKKSQDEGIPL